MDIGRSNIEKAVLAGVATAGIVSLAVLAPNTLQLLAPVVKKRRHYKYYIPKVIANLEHKKLIKITKKNHESYIELTPKGEALLDLYENNKLSITKPKKWDGKYRIVMFDIKEYKRSIRNEIRVWLQQLGFVRLQNSVWVYPYECREIVALLKTRYKVGRDVLYIITEEIENDSWLKRRFQL